MNKLFYPFLFCVFSLISCSDDSLPEKARKSDDASELDLKTSANASVTGLTRFKMAYLAIPSGGLYDGKRFYTNQILRANTSYDPYSIKKEYRGGADRMRFYVKPTSPSGYLSGTPYPYHFRSEICRYPWDIRRPIYTEEWLGFSYFFPTSSEGYTQNQTPVGIFQVHDGHNGPPTLQIEIAYPRQLYSTSKPYYNTPLGGELMIINSVRGIRWVVPGVRVVAGARLNIVVQIVYGTGSKGLFNVWINGKLVTWPGSSTVPAGNVGSTVYPNALWGGNTKLGIYHHQLRYKSGVDKNYAKGHTSMKMWMSDWNEIIRRPGDWDYKNSNGYSAVSTSSY